MKHKAIIIFTLFLLSSPSFALAAPSVRSQEVKTKVQEAIQESQENRQEIKTQAQEKVQEKVENRASNSAQRQENRQDIKTQSCEARINSIKTRSNSLTDFTNKVIDVFEKISLRVQEYYSQKVSPVAQVTDYSTLVSNVTTKKLAAQAALTKAQAIGLDFNCTSDDPKSLVSDFNEQMKLVKSSLSEYRSSIKNLISAIHPELKDVSPTPVQN